MLPAVIWHFLGLFIETCIISPGIFIGVIFAMNKDRETFIKALIVLLLVLALIGI